jgi:hypothetical protein
MCVSGRYVSIRSAFGAWLIAAACGRNHRRSISSGIFRAPAKRTPLVHILQHPTRLLARNADNRWRIAMNQTTSHDVAERIKQEHGALRDKLRRIHAVLAMREMNAEELRELLAEFQIALGVHFSNEEESEGFFESVTTHSPRLARQAGQLCIEHAALLRKAAELCRFAAAGCPSTAWWRELSSRCHEFSRQLMHHESAESQLLQQAYQDDLGDGGD